MNFFKPKYFQLYELIDPILFEGIANEYQLWMLFDERILRGADCLREIYGPCICNDWHEGGTHQWRGFRTIRCKEGALFSDHRNGRALDLKFKQIESEIIRQEILGNPKHDARKWVTCMEKDVSWLHISCRNTNGELVII